jgi:phage terminase large subunit-like protein
MTDGEILRLVVNMPRRRGKSSICSVAWFCWAWIKQPHLRWRFMSYRHDLSIRDSMKCRDIIRSNWYQRYWPLELREDQDSKQVFGNEKTGERRSGTIGAGVVGFGAHINVADDPHDYEVSPSATSIENDCSAWINGVHRSVNDPRTARFLVVMQRLRENDLSGRLIHADYEHLCLPEEYEKTRAFFTKEEAAKSKERDPIVMTKIQRERPEVRIGNVVINVRDPRKEDGELLSPERYPREIVEREKRQSASVFAAQNQQRPHPAEGTIITLKMFRYFRQENREGQPTFVLHVAPDRVRYYSVAQCVWFQTIDTAMKEKETNDRTAVCTWALTPGADLLLYDCWAYRIAVPYQMAALDNLARGRCVWMADKQEFIDLDPWPRPLLFQAVEDAASGIGLIQEGMARGRPFKRLSADRDPMAKVAPLADDYASGKVFHLEGAAWVSDYEEEALGFPHAQFKDRLMAASYGGYLKRHDAILKQHLNHDLVLSDRETAMRAEELRKQRQNVIPIRVNGGVVMLEYED